MDARPRHASGPPLRLFISYSHADEAHLQQLEKHLTPLVHEGEIEVWHDRKIPPSHPWAPVIDGHLRSADLVLLLITPDFLASNACRDESRLALERHEAGEARVLPVFVKATSLQGVPYRHLQGFPRDIQSRPQTIVGWPGGLDAAWASFVEQLPAVLHELRGGSPAYSRRAYLEGFLRRMDALDAEARFEPASFIEPEKDLEAPSSPADLSFDVDRDWSGEPPEPTGAPVHQTRSPLSQLLRQPRLHRVTALLGEPGSGKSVVLRRLGSELARAALEDSQAALPVWFSLGTYTGTTPEGAPSSLEDALGERLAHGTGGERGLASELKGMLAEGRLVLLFDGLDEMPRRDFDERLEALRAFTRSRGRVTMVFACRTRDFPPRSQFEVQQIRLAPFDARRVRDYLRKRGLPEPARVARQLLSPESSLAEVAGNPFMLALVAHHLDNHGRLPESRAQLLEEFVERQLGRLEHVAGAPRRRKLEEGLGRLSLGLLERVGTGTAVPLGELLGASGLGPNEGQRLVDAAISERLLVRDVDSGAVRFFHPRVQEVFAASALRALPSGEREAWLSARVDQAWVHEVFVLLVRPDVDLSRFFARQLEEVEAGLGGGPGDFVHEARLMLLGRMMEAAALTSDAPEVERMGKLLAGRFQSSSASPVPVLQRVRALRAARGAVVEQRSLNPSVKSALRSPSRWEQGEAFRALASLASSRPVVRDVLRKQVLREALTWNFVLERGYWAGLAASDSRLRFLVRSIHLALVLHLLAIIALAGVWGATYESYSPGATGLRVGIILSVLYQAFASVRGRHRAGQRSGLLQQVAALGMGAAFFAGWFLSLSVAGALKGPAWTEELQRVYDQRVRYGLGIGLLLALVVLFLELMDSSGSRWLTVRRLSGLGLLLGVASVLVLCGVQLHPGPGVLAGMALGLLLLGLPFLKGERLRRLMRSGWVLLPPVALLAFFLALVLVDSLFGSSRHVELLGRAFTASLCLWIVYVFWRGGRAPKREGFRPSGSASRPGRLMYLAFAVGLFLQVFLGQGFTAVLVPAFAVWVVCGAFQLLGRSWSAGRLAAPREPLSMERVPRVLQLALDERVPEELRRALVRRMGTLEPPSEVLALALRELSRAVAPSLDVEVCARAVDELEQRLLREGPRTREERLLREVPALHALLKTFSAESARRILIQWLAQAGVSRDELSRLESHPQLGAHARVLASVLAAPEEAGGPLSGFTRRRRTGAR
jgi:hypothetical protein